jgi:hypothetical protein
VVCDPPVGIGHSWNVPVVGSKWATLLVKNSTNQQQFPEGSNAKPTGPLFAVGIVHSVKVAEVAAKMGTAAPKDNNNINDKTTTTFP